MSGYWIWLMLPSWEMQTFICAPSTTWVNRKPLPGVPLHVPPDLGTSTRGNLEAGPPRLFIATSDAAVSSSAKPR